MTKREMIADLQTRVAALEKQVKQLQAASLLAALYSLPATRYSAPYNPTYPSWTFLPRFQ